MFIDFNNREAIVKSHINKDKKEIISIYGYSFGLTNEKDCLKNIGTSIKVNLSKLNVRKKHENSTIKLKYNTKKGNSEALFLFNNSIGLNNNLKNDEIFLFGEKFVMDNKKKCKIITNNKMN